MYFLTFHYQCNLRRQNITPSLEALGDKPPLYCHVHHFPRLCTHLSLLQTNQIRNYFFVVRLRPHWRLEASFLRRACFCLHVHVAAPGDLWKFEGFPEDTVYGLIIFWLNVHVLDEVVEVAFVLLVQVGSDQTCRIPLRGHDWLVSDLKKLQFLLKRVSGGGKTFFLYCFLGAQSVADDQLLLSRLYVVHMVFVQLITNLRPYSLFNLILAWLLHETGTVQRLSFLLEILIMN